MLSEGAVYWAVAFWHEERALAREVVHIVNDIGQLHLSMWLDDGTYKEGVCQYSIMSLTSSLAVAVLYARAFGERWGSVNTTRFAAGARWQLDSYDTAGYAIDFGDSHSCRGTTPVTLFAAYSAEVVAPTDAQGQAAGTSAVEPCVAREWATMAYHLTVHDPWQFWPVLAAHDWDGIIAQCGLGAGAGNAGIRPMGPGHLDVYEAYGSFKAPLLLECTAAAAARFGCNATPGPPKLKDAAVYSHLAVQARPNSWPHSEVDFGTFKWTAWGQHLIGEFGYGVIGSAINQWDGRRLAEMDNNPVGHNTVVIREAYATGSDEINFSQLNFVAGTITKLDIPGVPCVHLDGGDIYGASRTNGWFQRMHRWVCEVGTGGFVIIDSFAARNNRGSQAIYGAAYGGPNFAEPNRTDRQSELTVDEYFHTPSWLQGQVIAGWSPAARAFNRSAIGKWCSHTDVEIRGGSRANRAVLRSRCGEDHEDGDAVGEVVGWSGDGGRFVVDGLVSSPDRWGVERLHQHRFRYEGASTVGPGGDLRAFLMTASVTGVTVPTPSWIRGCSADRTCVTICVGTQLYRFTVEPDGLAFAAADTGETCDGASEPTDSPTGSPTGNLAAEPPTAPPGAGGAAGSGGRQTSGSSAVLGAAFGAGAFFLVLGVVATVVHRARVRGSSQDGWATVDANAGEGGSAAVTETNIDTVVMPAPESECDVAPVAEIRAMYTTTVFVDGPAAQEAVNGSKIPFAHDLAQPAVSMEDPFAATAVQPAAAPQASTLSPPTRAAPRRPSNYTPPPAYGAGAWKLAPVVRPKNARTINALNPFGEEDSHAQDEDSSDEDQPPPEPTVKIAALKEKKATRPVPRPRKIGSKKDRKNSGGALMFDDDADAESEI